MSEGRDLGRGTKAKMEKVLGQYSILAELARGGMGRVYVARRTGQAGFERYVAIKVMHQQLNDDQKWVMMLLDEAHIASKLHHPNVVPVLDIGTFGEGYYLVMDYVEGCSLQQLLKKSPEERPIKAVISILLDSLRGLHAVHTLRGDHDEELHVVHRDVSPHNLLLGVDGGCRVTDFGIAKAKQRFTDTDVGTHKGKLAFMAPEQMRGLPNVDARVDVWAAGVTLYEALTGVHPFRMDNDAATIHAIMGGEIPLPSTVGLCPPVAFDSVIMRALQRDPEGRYASADQFADTLRAAALHEHVLGSSSDVAQWVKAVCGPMLAARRRKLAGIPKGGSDETITSATSSLPKLWFNQEGGNTSASASSPRVTIEPGGWRTAGSSFAALASSRPRVLTSAAVLAVAVAVGLGVLLTRGVRSEHVEGRAARDHVPALPSTPAPAALAAPAPANAPAAPMAPVPAASHVEPPAAPAQVAPRAAAEPDLRNRRPRFVAPASRQHRPAATGGADIINTPTHALSGMRNDAAAAPVAHTPAPTPAASPVAPAAPARNAQGLDRNPYVLGE